jgi:hypothetical protein
MKMLTYQEWKDGGNLIRTNASSKLIVLELKVQISWLKLFNHINNGSVDSQVEIFEKFRGETIQTYLNLYDELGTIKNVGRFTLFLYLEMISVLTDLKMTPDRIDWKYADNCREGLEYHYARHLWYARTRI